MKKNIKNYHAGRITSLLIVLCMVLSIVPITAFATEVEGGKTNNTQGDITIEGSYDGFGMEIYLNNVRVGTESATVTGTAQGYTTGDTKNKITVQLAFGDGNIGSVTINGTNMTLPDGTQDRAEFEVEPANKYIIVVTKSQDTSNAPKTIIWDSDKTNNPNIKDSELLKNGTIEILDIKDPNDNSVGLDNVNQDLNKNNGWASIIPGSKVILKLKPDYGYQLTEISINDEKLVAGKEQSTFEYIMPNTNVHISGIFEKVEDKVNTGSDKVKNGTIELGGKEIDSGSVVLSVNDATLSKEQITNFEEKANGYEISSYFDINLDQVIYKGSATDVWANELKELNNEATITLQLENGVNGNEVVIVHEKHDGTYEIIPITYEPATNTITFKTTSFSNYAIASKATSVSDYEIVEGANGAWTQNSDGTLVFRANGDFDKFTDVKVDGTLIDAKNYTAVSGSTVITLKADYLKTLSGGTHKITVVYTDGECSADFEVKKEASEQTTPSEGDKSDTTTPTGGKDTTSPQTGDNSNLALWFAVLFISSGGVIAYTVYSKRRKLN